MDELRKVLDSIAESVEFFGVELTDVNQRGQFGNTPLKVAAVRGDIGAARLLLDNGAEVNAVVEDGFTALHFAAGFGHVEVVMLLLQRGALIDIANEDGRTAADLARLLGEAEAAEAIDAFKSEKT